MYTVEFEPGDDERLPAWEVVKWTVINEKGRVGRLVEAFYGEHAEEDARWTAQALNHDEESEIYAEFG